MASHESIRKMTGTSRTFTVQDFRKLIDGLPDDAVVKVRVSPKHHLDPRGDDLFHFEVDLAHTGQEG